MEYVAGSIFGTTASTVVYSPTARAVVGQDTLPDDTVQVVSFQCIVSGTGSSLSSSPIAGTAQLTGVENDRALSVAVIVDAYRVCLPLLARW